MYALMKKCYNLLADNCDYAEQKDGVGFNRSDAYMGHDIAFYKVWKKAWAQKAYSVLKKYTNQLKRNHGIDYADIEEPNWEESEWENDDGQLRLSFEDIEFLLASNPSLKWNGLIEKAKWMNPTQFYRKFQLNDEGELVKRQPIVKKASDFMSKEKLLALFAEVEPKHLARMGKYVRSIEIDNLPYPQDFWDFYKENKGELFGKGNLFGISKYNGPWEVTMWTNTYNINEVEEEIIEEEEEIEIKVPSFKDTNLYEYQQPHAEMIAHALLKYGVALDNSGTGTGKTFTNLNVCKALGLRPLVICPKAVMPSWERSIEVLDMDILTVVNYELIRTGKMSEKQPFKRKAGFKRVSIDCPWIQVEKNPKKGQYESKYLISFNLPNDGVIIFDEAHRCKNKGTLNTQMLIAAVDAKVKILMLSATIAENPLKMFGSAKALGFYDQPWEFYNSFLPKWDCGKGRYAWEFWGNAKTMVRLNRAIGDKMDGMDVNQLIKMGLFPESQILAETYNVNGETAKLNKIYEEMKSELKELKEKADKVNPLDHLQVRQKAAQRAELLKVPAVVEMAQDLIEEGHSVVIFTNYTQTLTALCEKLDTHCTIYGGNSGAENEANRQAFEDNKELVIICNIAAAREGIDLHDVHHERTRISILFPSDSAQNMKQALGRIHRAGGTRSQQRIFYAEGTIEERICENVRGKLANIAALNDGDLAVESLF